MRPCYVTEKRKEEQKRQCMGTGKPVIFDTSLPNTQELASHAVQYQASDQSLTVTNQHIACLDLSHH